MANSRDNLQLDEILKNLEEALDSLDPFVQIAQRHSQPERSHSPASAATGEMQQPLHAHSDPIVALSSINAGSTSHLPLLTPNREPESAPQLVGNEPVSAVADIARDRSPKPLVVIQEIGRPAVSDIDDETIHTDCNPTFVCLIPYIPAIFAAFNDASSDALSLYEANNQSIMLLAAASGVSFLAAFELSGQSTADNMKEIAHMITQRQTPPTWPALSRAKIFTVCAIAGGAAAWCAFSESTQAYDFVGSVARDYGFANIKYIGVAWKGLTIATAFGSGVTKLLTDNYEAGKFLWRVSAKEFIPYSNRGSYAIAPFVSSINLYGAFTSALMSYMTIKEIFNINTTYGKSLLAAGCVTDLASNFVFSGGTIAEQADQFCGTIGNQAHELIYNHRMTLRISHIAAFLTSISLAVFLSYVKRPLNQGYYESLANDDLSIPREETPDYLFMTLAWINFVYEVLLVTSSLNPQMTHFFGHLEDKVTSFLSYMINLCTQQSTGEYPAAEYSPIDQEDPESARPGSPLLQSSLFARPATPPAIDATLNIQQAPTLM